MFQDGVVGIRICQAFNKKLGLYRKCEALNNTQRLDTKRTNWRNQKANYPFGNLKHIIYIYIYKLISKKTAYIST
jgi:hypothetical protein